MNKKYLLHYGVPGMKWGVRKYQNYDGSLTSLGREHYGVGSSKNKDSSNVIGVKKMRRNNGSLTVKGRNEYVFNGDYSKDIIVKKGSEIKRVSGANETLDEKRKYVSVTPADSALYKTWAVDGALWNKNKQSDRYEYTYTSDKKLKFLSADKATEYLVEKYGNKKIKDLFSEKKYDADYDEFANKFLSKTMKTKMSEIEEHFAKEYDGIVDPEDSFRGRNYNIMPLILFNPKDKVKETKKENIKKDVNYWKDVQDKEYEEHLETVKNNQLSKSYQTKIKQFSDQGMTINEIAEKLGISETTVKKYK